MPLCFLLCRQRDGRSAISLSHVLQRGKRYDPTAAKKKEFYSKAKQFKSYQRLLKREGYDTSAVAAQPSPVDADVDKEVKRPQPFEDSGRQRRREEADDEEEADEEGDADDGRVHEAAEDAEQERPHKRRRRESRAVQARLSEEAKAAEVEARRKAMAASREARLQSFKRHASKTRKGQPVSAATQHSDAATARWETESSRLCCVVVGRSWPT